MGKENTYAGSIVVEISFPKIGQARNTLESLGFKAIPPRSGIMEYDDIFKSSTGVTARFFPNTEGSVQIRLQTHEPSNEHDREKLFASIKALLRVCTQPPSSAIVAGRSVEGLKDVTLL